jgi:hypothetical protein
MILNMFLPLILTFVSILITEANHSAAPKEIHFAGFFAPLNASGYRDVKQLEHLAAFIMAINEINNKTDGVYDDLLPETLIIYFDPWRQIAYTSDCILP